MISWQEKYLVPLDICVEGIAESLKYTTPQEAWDSWNNADEMITILVQLKIPFEVKASFVLEIFEHYIPTYYTSLLKTPDNYEVILDGFHKDLKRCIKSKNGADKFYKACKVHDKRMHEQWALGAPMRGELLLFIDYIEDLCAFTFSNKMNPVIARVPEFGDSKFQRAQKYYEAANWLLACIRKHFPDPLIYFNEDD